MAAQPTLPPWLLGVWKREWIRRAGATTNTLTVRVLQTPTMFGDVRIPIDRPSFPHAKALTDLTDAQLADLAGQRGFFGYTTVEGDVATWHHEIDFQPPDGEADTGRLERIGTSGLDEHALDGSYVERWASLSRGDGRFLVVRVARPERLDRVLLVAGDHFAYARNRAKDLPTAASLAELIATTHATRETVLGYLDCELSYGTVRGGKLPWEIVNSTLPWREGRHLEFADRVAVDPAGVLWGAALPGESWTFPVDTLPAGDRRALFPAQR